MLCVSVEKELSLVITDMLLVIFPLDTPSLYV